MKKSAAAVVLPAVLLSACASSQPRPRLPATLDANPSALLALEIAMAQRATEKGGHDGFREYAAPDAVLFVPERVAAAAWLKDTKNPLGLTWPAKRDVYRVIMSCDGKSGVTHGAWKAPGGQHGYFTTVWQRYEKRDGTGKWLWTLTHDNRLNKPLKAPEFVQTETSSCKGKAPASIAAPPEGVEMKQGLSRDQSLSWTWQYRGDRSRSLEVKIWDGAKNIAVLKDEVAAK